jgi:hypothetical protein
MRGLGGGMRISLIEGLTIGIAFGLIFVLAMLLPVMFWLAVGFSSVGAIIYFSRVHKW